MPKLQINDDGTVTLPLAGDPPAVTLPEPTMNQMAEITALAETSDGVLPTLPQFPSVLAGELPTPEQLDALAAYNKVLTERTTRIFGAEAPYGNAVLAIVKLLTGTEVTGDQVYGWVMSPATLRRIMRHFQRPLSGEESDEET